MCGGSSRMDRHFPSKHTSQKSALASEPGRCRSLMLLTDWQADKKGRARIGIVDDMDRPVVRHDNRFANGKTDPHAFFLGAPKSVEHMLDRIVCNSGTAIGNAHPD